MSLDEACARREILWFWYHHAISSALWKHADWSKAQEFATKAIQYQPDDSPNRITRLLYLLLHDRYSEARTWVAETRSPSESETAKELVLKYERGELVRQREPDGGAGNV